MNDHGQMRYERGTKGEHAWTCDQCGRIVTITSTRALRVIETGDFDATHHGVSTADDRYGMTMSTEVSQ
jgi:hypothetical protein